MTNQSIFDLPNPNSKVRGGSPPHNLGPALSMSYEITQNAAIYGNRAQRRVAKSRLRKWKKR